MSAIASTCNFGAAIVTGLLIIMNEIQTSQLAEEQRNASRLGNQALKLNKSLATGGPIVISLATIGSVFIGSPVHRSWAVVVRVVAGRWLEWCTRLSMVGKLAWCLRYIGAKHNILEKELNKLTFEDQCWD
ncbi:Petal formation-expressed [Dillenia turbinata]|uniref:Petal formation-expressed n=1 Tax=Dillenia turbinata TaxID=194707 RepID=A0AAN8UJ65_9MAGN